ncbi:MAG: four helix bundle protein [Gemmatirosa sp.]|nr:four helix bundle protein [Gemmatirosa sp.]
MTADPTNTPARGFRGLRVWHEAVALATEAFHVADALPSAHAGLADQIRRAAGSVHANIAEGSTRPSRRDFLRFIGMARGSLAELEAHVELARRATLISEELLTPVFTRARHVGRLLPALARALRRRDDAVPQTRHRRQDAPPKTHDR